MPEISSTLFPLPPVFTFTSFLIQHTSLDSWIASSLGREERKEEGLRRRPQERISYNLPSMWDRQTYRCVCDLSTYEKICNFVLCLFLIPSDFLLLLCPLSLWRPSFSNFELELELPSSPSSFSHFFRCNIDSFQDSILLPSTHPSIPFLLLCLHEIKWFPRRVEIFRQISIWDSPSPLLSSPLFYPKGTWNSLKTSTHCLENERCGQNRTFLDVVLVF